MKSAREPEVLARKRFPGHPEIQHAKFFQDVQDVGKRVKIVFARSKVISEHLGSEPSLPLASRVW
jgi:hypothetical protein